MDPSLGIDNVVCPLFPPDGVEVSLGTDNVDPSLGADNVVAPLAGVPRLVADMVDPAFGPDIVEP